MLDFFYGLWYNTVWISRNLYSDLWSAYYNIKCFKSQVLFTNLYKILYIGRVNRLGYKVVGLDKATNQQPWFPLWAVERGGRGYLINPV